MLKKLTIVLCALLFTLSFTNCNSGFSFDDETGETTISNQTSAVKEYEDWGPRW